MEIKIAKYNETNEPLIQKEDDKRLLSGVIIHICDLSGPTKTFTLAKEWSLRISKEFTS